MKNKTPDWKDAPSWANWLAMDSDGFWYWYENRPFAGNKIFRGDGTFVNVSEDQELVISDNWKESLQQRPAQ